MILNVIVILLLFDSAKGDCLSSPPAIPGATITPDTTCAPDNKCATDTNVTYSCDKDNATQATSTCVDTKSLSVWTPALIHCPCVTNPTMSEGVPIEGAVACDTKPCPAQSKATFNCTANGAEVVLHCLFGVWSPTVTCADVPVSSNCEQSPPKLDDADQASNVTCSAQSRCPLGETVRYQCLSNSSVTAISQCLNGNWSRVNLTCPVDNSAGGSANCTAAPPSPPTNSSGGGNVTCSKDQPCISESNVTFTCNGNEEKKQTLICNRGQWSQLTLDCSAAAGGGSSNRTSNSSNGGQDITTTSSTIQNCTTNPLEPPVGATMSPAINCTAVSCAPDTAVEYQCGGPNQSPVTAKCEANGAWSQVSLKCPCVSQPELINATTSWSKNCTAEACDSGTMVLFNCSAGVQAYKSCVGTKWMPDNLTCAAAEQDQCSTSPPVAPADAELVKNKTCSSQAKCIANDIATYQCVSDNSKTVTSICSKVWSAVALDCTVAEVATTVDPSVTSSDSSNGTNSGGQQNNNNGNTNDTNNNSNNNNQTTASTATTTNTPVQLKQCYLGSCKNTIGCLKLLLDNQAYSYCNKSTGICAITKEVTTLVDNRTIETVYRMACSGSSSDTCSALDTSLQRLVQGSSQTITLGTCCNSHLCNDQWGKMKGSDLKPVKATILVVQVIFLIRWGLDKI